MDASEFHPEGYPKNSPALEEQVRRLLRRGAREIAECEEYLAGADALIKVVCDEALKELDG